MNRVGLFGYGRQGKYLANLLLDSQKVKIKFLVEENEALKDTMVRDFKDKGLEVPQALSLSEFTKDIQNIGKESNGFAVVTTTSAHVPIIKHLAPLKKPIFVEKPFSSTFKAAEQGWNELDKYGTQCFVGFQRRIDKNIRAIYDRTRGKEIKAVRAYHCDNPSASTEYYSKAGPQALDQGIHELDLISWFRDGELPQEVLAYGFNTMPELEGVVEDRCLVFLKFKNGGSFNLQMSRDSVTQYVNQFIVETSEEELRVPLQMETTIDSKMVPKYTWDYMVKYREAYEDQMKYFIELMENSELKSITKRKEILTTMKTVEAILLSMKERRVVKLQQVL